MNLFLPRLTITVCGANAKGGYFRTVIKILSFVTRKDTMYPASTRNDRNKRKSFLIRLTSFLREDLLTAFEDLPLLLNSIIS